MFKTFFRSMGGRVFLILMAGVVASAVLALTLAAYEQRDAISHLRNRYAAEHVEQLVLTLEAAPAKMRPAIAAIVGRFGARADFSQSTTVIGSSPNDEFISTLRRGLGEGRNISAIQRVGADCPVRPGFEYVGEMPRCRTVFITLLDGTPLRLDIGMPPKRTLPLFRATDLLLVFGVCMAGLAFLVAHIATKPLRQLAQAANDLGDNIEHPPLQEDQGPTEVREAASAFNSMQTSLRDYIHERTHMLAAITHDLQTPLTRLRLRLEKVTDEELRMKLLADLAATQSLAKEGLELARSQDSEEPFEMVDVDSLLDSICSDAVDTGLEVTHGSQVGVSVMAQPKALRRCILNLVDNAVKYGNFAHLSAKKEGGRVTIFVIDGGAGIPDDQLDTVFRPFHRLESSRSRCSGGTGLGLTIASNIAKKHRGALNLRNIRSGGLGLEASVSLNLN